MSSTTLHRAIAMALLATSAPAVASQFDYDLYAGVAHSDNVRLTTSRPISQTILIPGINFTWDQQGAALQAHVIGNLEYRSYLGNRFSDQQSAQLNGQALWTLSPRRLDLNVQDYAGIQPLDSLASDAPNNRQQTNVFMVGPVLHFRLGETVRGQAELRYINSYAEKTRDFNSNRAQAALRLIKDLSPTARMSLNLDTERVRLHTTTIYPNYDRHELFAHYVSTLPKVDLDLELGATRIDYDRAGARAHTSPLVRASATWRISARNNLTLDGRRQYSDAAHDLMLRPGTNPLRNDYGVGIGDTMVNPQVFLEHKTELVYGFRGERVSFTLAPYYRKLDYLGGSVYDQRGTGATTALDYRMRPTLTVSLFASRENLRYTTMHRVDKTLLAGIGIVGQRNSHWSWRAALTRQQRHSTAAGQSYHETRIYFGLVYKR